MTGSLRVSGVSKKNPTYWSRAAQIMDFRSPLLAFSFNPIRDQDSRLRFFIMD
ncbi:hypothetical protein D1AOALGA4SA_9490 [Olavius algarvensis Delta 1 endosymbiont]|nr:hypothetical protein D1AOALGA4SA_9490 [Olavius algarvensis Delta 1 endosymbiont]